MESKNNILEKCNQKLVELINRINNDDVDDAGVVRVLIGIQSNLEGSLPYIKDDEKTEDIVFCLECVKSFLITLKIAFEARKSLGRGDLIIGINGLKNLFDMKITGGRKYVR